MTRLGKRSFADCIDAAAAISVALVGEDRFATDRERFEAVVDVEEPELVEASSRCALSLFQKAKREGTLRKRLPVAVLCGSLDLADKGIGSGRDGGLKDS